MARYDIETPYGNLDIEHDGDADTLTKAVQQWIGQQRLSRGDSQAGELPNLPQANSPIPRTDKAGGLEDHDFAPGKTETVGESINRPMLEGLFTRPKSDTTVAGITRSVEGAAEGLTSPVNVALVGASLIPGAGPVINKAAAAYFGFKSMQAARDEFGEAVDARTPGDRAEHASNAVLGVLMGMAGVHGATLDARAPAGTRPSSMPQSEINRATTQTELQQLAPKTAAAVAEPKPFAPSEILDGHNLAKSKLREGFADQPPAIQQARQEAIDHIDKSLLDYDRNAVSESAARVEQQRQSKAPTEAPAKDTAQAPSSEEATPVEEVKQTVPPPVETPVSAAGSQPIPSGEAAEQNYAKEAEDVRQRADSNTSDSHTAGEVEREPEMRAKAAELSEKSGSPWVTIADVLEGVGLPPTPEGFARGKGIIMGLLKQGKIQLGAGDWSLSDSRTKAWNTLRRGERNSYLKFNPEKGNIVGPALADESGALVAKGEVGKTHANLILDSALRGEDVSDAKRGFHDEQGNFVSRTDAAQRALDKGQIDQTTYDKAMAREGDNKGLHSEDLIAKEDTSAKETKPSGPGQKMVEDLKKVGRVNRDPTKSIAGELGYYSREEREQLQQHLGTEDATPKTLAAAITGKKAIRESGSASPYVDEPAGPEGRGHPTEPVAKEAFGEDYTGGPGAMGPREAEAMKKDQQRISIANATVNERRTAEGNLKLLNEERQSNPETWSEAEKRIEEDPTYAGGLVDKLRDGSKTSVTHIEEAALMHEAVKVKTQRDQWAERASDPKAPEIERSEARSEWQKLEDRLNQVDQATKIAGTSAGRALQIRRMQVNDDFTYAGLERRARAAKLESLTPEESAKLKQQAEKIQSLQKDLEESRTAADEGEGHAEMARIYEAEIKSVEKELAKQPKVSKPVLDIARGIVDRWKREADEARASISNLFGGEGGGVGGVGGGPGGKKLGSAAEQSRITAIAKIMRAHIGEVGLNSAEVFDRLTTEFGGKVKPYLKSAWEQTRKLIDSENAPPAAKELAKRGGGKKVQGETEIKARAKAEATAGENLSQGTVGDLVREKLKSGMRNWDEIMASVHGDLKGAYPDATERDVRRVYSEYGKRTYPSTEEIATANREGKQIVKIQEDIDRITKDNLDPEKKGYQRDKATQQIRELTKLRNDLLQKRVGPPSPEKLATRDEAKQTALRNSIEDLDKQLRTGEKMERPSGAPDSTATEQLRAERDAMRAKWQEIENAKKPKMSPEERANQTAIKAAQRSIEELDRRIREGEISKPKTDVSVSTELEQLRSQRDAMSAHLKEMKRSENPPKTEDERKISALEKRAQEVREKISSGDISNRASKSTVDTREVAEAKSELQRLNAQLEEMRKAANPKISDVDKQVQQLAKNRDRISDIISGKIDPTKPKDFNPLSTAAENLKAEILAMNQLAAEMRREALPKSDPNAIREKAQIKALEDAIKRYEEKTKNADFSTKGKTNGPDTQAVARLRDIRDARRVVYEAAKKAGKPIRTPDEIYNDTRMRAVQKQLDELNQRISTGDYTPKPKPVPKQKFSALAKGEADLSKAKRQVKDNIEEIRMANRSTPQRIIDAVKNGLQTIRAVPIAGHGTVGMVTHAGGLIFRPSVAKIYWTNFGRQWGMWLNKSFHEQLIYKLKTDPEFEMWKKAGASIDPEKTYTDYGMYAKWLGKFGEAGGRGFDALKLARMELNKADWAKVSNTIKANPEAALETQKRISEINNKATGAIAKGNEPINQLARNKWSENIFFAPKLYASRWSRIVLDPYKTAGTFFDWKNASDADKIAATNRLKHAAEFTGTLVAGLVVNQAILSATSSSQKVNFSDPTKSDWLKFKVSGKEVSVDGGLLDPVRLIGQVVLGDLVQNRTSNQEFREGSRFDKAGHDMLKYLRGKLNPTFGLIVDASTGSDFQGRPLPTSIPHLLAGTPLEKEKFKDQPAYTWPEWVLQHGPIPLAAGAKIAYDEMRKNGLSEIQAKDILKGAAYSVAGTTGWHFGTDYSTEPPATPSKRLKSIGSLRKPRKKKETAND